MCEVHKPEKRLGVDLRISNLSQEGLTSLDGRGAYIETDRGDFILSNKFFGDELVYLLTQLTTSRKINWTVDKFKNWRGWVETRYVSKYDRLNIVLSHTEGGGLNISLTFDGDERFCLTSSRLIDQLYVEVTRLSDPDNGPVYMKGIMDKGYLDMQTDIANRAIDKLRSLYNA
ncbi:MAG: hypothetical protein A2405_03780 [Candidatus Yanofskybacteria bacterium RIFOXYC1_FULL_44_16]|nr:MAG: hypothetical protein A2405_03780 [Candidatus Yanofskybacteria bacterium RIFOXYC1_FULL_44_16]